MGDCSWQHGLSSSRAEREGVCVYVWMCQYDVALTWDYWRHLMYNWLHTLGRSWAGSSEIWQIIPQMVEGKLF